MLDTSAVKLFSRSKDSGDQTDIKERGNVLTAMMLIALVAEKIPATDTKLQAVSRWPYAVCRHTA